MSIDDKVSLLLALNLCHLHELNSLAVVIPYFMLNVNAYKSHQKLMALRMKTLFTATAQIIVFFHTTFINSSDDKLKVKLSSSGCLTDPKSQTDTPTGHASMTTDIEQQIE